MSYQISIEREHEIVKLYKNGLSYRDIPANTRTIMRVLKKYDIKPRKGSEAIKTQWSGKKGEERRALERSKAKYRIITTDGYYAVLYPYSHRSKDKGRVKEHMLIAEEKIGRRLRKGEVVHHINEIKTDNRPENLQVMTASKHHKLHYEQRTTDTKGRLQPK